MRAAPAVSCAMCAKKCAHEHTGTAGALRHSLRNGFTAYFVLSPETNSFATVPAGLMELRSGWIEFATDSLTPAHGCQDHTSIFWHSVKHAETKKTL